MAKKYIVLEDEDEVNLTKLINNLVKYKQSLQDQEEHRDKVKWKEIKSLLTESSS